MTNHLPTTAATEKRRQVIAAPSTVDRPRAEVVIFVDGQCQMWHRAQVSRIARPGIATGGWPTSFAARSGSRPVGFIHELTHEHADA